MLFLKRDALISKLENIKGPARSAIINAAKDGTELEDKECIEKVKAFLFSCIPNQKKSFLLSGLLQNIEPTKA